MDGSILNTIKKMLGYQPEMTAFDTDIIAQINAGLSALTQMGVGPENGFFILGPEETFDDFVTDEYKNKMIPTYLFFKVKLGFDPPTSSALLQTYKDELKEYEFRLQVQHDTKTE